MASDSNTNLFDLMGIGPNSSPDEIADAFDRLVEENKPDPSKNLSVEEELAREVRLKEARRAYKILSDPQKRAVYIRQDLARRSAEAGNPRVRERNLRPETLRPLSAPQSGDTRVSDSPRQTSSGINVPIPPTRPPLVPNAIASRVPILGKFNTAVNSTVGKFTGAISNALKPVTSAASKLLAPLLSKIGPMLAKLLGALTTGPVGAAIAAGTFLMSYGKDLARLTVGLGLALAGTSITTAVTATAITAGVAVAALAIIIPLIMFIINSGAYVVPPSHIASPGGSPSVINGCAAGNLPKPVANDVRFSSDGRYAYPMAPFSEMYYGCIHWDGELSTDMGITGVRSGGYRPVVAYTSGRIDSAYIDSIGGNAIVLAGDDGRFYYYAHNCALYVAEGQRVTVGEVIATSDTTGSAATTSDPIEHLHFAIGTDSRFEGGGGEICPSYDFEQKFRLGRCLFSTQNQCKLPPTPTPQPRR